MSPEVAERSPIDQAASSFAALLRALARQDASPGASAAPIPVIQMYASAVLLASDDA